MPNTRPETTSTNREPSATAVFQPLLTEREVARRLALSIRTLQDWRFRGGGPRFLKCGAAIRYRWADVEIWMEEQSRASTSGSNPAAA